jgi:hypothetical protein
VRDFRWRHWCFTREYILKHTSHPTATGGSPIVTVSNLAPSQGHRLMSPSGYQISWVLSLRRWLRRLSSANPSMVSATSWKLQPNSARH